MTKQYLLGTVLAAAIMAAPGIAAAQNNPGNPNWNNTAPGLNNKPATTARQSRGLRQCRPGGYAGTAMPLPDNNNNDNNNNNADNQRPSQRNPLLADNGDVRASKFIGTTVHNNRDQNIGSVGRYPDRPQRRVGGRLHQQQESRRAIPGFRRRRFQYPRR